MRKENRNSEGECYQVNSSVRAVYDESAGKLESLKINGEEVKNDSFYSICIQGYHLSNCEHNLNVTEEELTKSDQSKVISTSATEILEECMRNNQNISREVEGRLVYK